MEKTRTKKRPPLRDEAGRFKTRGRDNAAFFWTEDGRIQVIPISAPLEPFASREASAEADRLAEAWGLQHFGFGFIDDGFIACITGSLPLILDGEGIVTKV